MDARECACQAEDRGARRALADGARRAPDPEDGVSAGCDIWADQQPAEQAHQALLGCGGGIYATHAGRQHLRYELRPHAGTGPAMGLPGLAYADGTLGHRTVSVLQAQGVAVDLPIGSKSCHVVRRTPDLLLTPKRFSRLSVAM